MGIRRATWRGFVGRPGESGWQPPPASAEQVPSLICFLFHDPCPSLNQPSPSLSTAFPLLCASLPVSSPCQPLVLSSLAAHISSSLQNATQRPLFLGGALSPPPSWDIPDLYDSYSVIRFCIILQQCTCLFFLPLPGYLANICSRNQMWEHRTKRAASNVLAVLKTML